MGVTCAIRNDPAITMKQLAFAVLGLLAVVISVEAQMHDPCRTCQILILIARRSFNNTVNDQAALQAQLLMECDNLAQHGFSADEVAGCKAQVNAKIGDIYNELHDHPEESSRDVCVHIGECNATRTINNIARSGRSFLCDGCRTVFKEIDHLLPDAEGLTEEALKVFLDGLCDEVPFISGILKEYVNKYLDDIFNYIKEHGTINAEGICKLLHCC